MSSRSTVLESWFLGLDPTVYILIAWRFSCPGTRVPHLHAITCKPSSPGINSVASQINSFFPTGITYNRLCGRAGGKKELIDRGSDPRTQILLINKIHSPGQSLTYKINYLGPIIINFKLMVLGCVSWAWSWRPGNKNLENYKLYGEEKRFHSWAVTYKIYTKFLCYSPGLMKSPPHQVTLQPKAGTSRQILFSINLVFWAQDTKFIWK